MATSAGWEFLPRTIAEAFSRTLGADAAFTEDVEVDALKSYEDRAAQLSPRSAPKVDFQGIHHV